MKVLVVGGAGLLGVELVQELHRCGYEVIAPSREEMNITDEEAIRSYVRSVRPDAVINVAAAIGVEWCEEHPLQAWQINALGPGLLSRALREEVQGAVLVQVSTSDVFGQISRRAFSESDRGGPVNVYGWSKYAGERLVEQEMRRASAPYYILRLGWLYGNARATFVDKVVEALRGGEDFLVSADQFNVPTWTRDAAVSLITLLTKCPQAGIYHGVPRSLRRISKYDIAEFIARLFELSPGSLKRSTSQAIVQVQRPQNAVLRPSRALVLPRWEASLRTYLLERYGKTI